MGAKEAIPTQVTRSPEFTITNLKPWVKDATGRFELPGDHIRHNIPPSSPG